MALSPLYTTTIDLSQSGNGLVATNVSGTSTTITATSFLTGPQGIQGIQGPAGSNASATTDASQLTSGTLPIGRLPVLIGDVTSPAGSNVTAIASGVIVDTDINTGANIDATKLGTGIVNNTEFNYLDGVTSALQTQLNSKQASLTLTTTGSSGAATLVGATLNIPQYSGGGTGVTDGDKGDITVSGTGTIWTIDTGLAATKIGGGTVDNTEFGYLDGVTSSIQTQLGTKLQLGGDIGGTISAPTVSFANDTLHVLKAGDTMTGQLLSQPTSTSVVGLKVNAPTGTTVNVFEAGINGTVHLLLGSNNILQSRDIRPIVNGTYGLGSTTMYWLNTYSSRLNLNSTAYLDGGTAGGVVVSGIQANNGTIGVLQVTNTTNATGFAQALNAFSPNVPSSTGLGNGSQFRVGIAATNFNTGEFNFMYYGSGSTSNRMAFGMYGLAAVIAYDGLGQAYFSTSAIIGSTSLSPTHTLTLPSTATGIALYNTTDQTTNYERVVTGWSGNILNGFVLSAGGTGTVNRQINIAAGGGATLNLTSAGVLILNRGGTGLSPISSVTGTYNASTGNQILFGLTPTYNQSSTAGYTALLVNPTETATGSGTKLLADYQVGGVSKFSVDNTGRQLVNSIPNEMPISTTTGINAFTTGNTALYTVPTGRTLVVTKAIIRVSAASAVTAGPTASIGGTTTGDVFASTALTALTATTKAFCFTEVGMFTTVPAGTVVNFNISSAATGTSETIIVDLMGYLL